MPSSLDKPILSLVVPNEGRKIEDLEKLLFGLNRDLQAKCSIEIIVCVNVNFEPENNHDQ